MMERSDYEELEPLLKSKSEAEVTTRSTILQIAFCLFLLLFPGKDTKNKINLYTIKLRVLTRPTSVEGTEFLRYLVIKKVSQITLGFGIWHKKRTVRVTCL